MYILDKFPISENNENSMVYTVCLESGIAMDVKVCEKTGLIYVMQNADGSTAYDQDDPDYTYPDCDYDEEAVIQLVKEEHFRPSLVDVLAGVRKRATTPNETPSDDDGRTGGREKADDFPYRIQPDYGGR